MSESIQHPFASTSEMITEFRRLTEYTTLVKSIEPRAKAFLAANPKKIEHMFKQATRMGDQHLVEFILKHTDISPVAIHEAFLHAIKNGDAVTVQTLLAKIRDIQTPHNTFPLIEAVRKGYDHIVRILLTETWINPSSGGNWAMIVAVCAGNTRIASMLCIAISCRMMPDPTNIGRILTEPWVSASDLNNLLMESKFDPLSNNSQVLVFAAQYGNMDLMNKILADHRVDPLARDHAALQSAAVYDQLEALKLLLSRLPSENLEVYETIIGLAARSGSVSIVKYILDIAPETAISEATYVAAKNQRCEVLRILLADSRVVDSFSITENYLELVGKTRSRVSLTGRDTQLRSLKTLHFQKVIVLEYLTESESHHYTDRYSKEDKDLDALTHVGTVNIGDPLLVLGFVATRT